MAKTRIAAQLARKWRANPGDRVSAIVHTTGEIEEVATLLEQQGMRVTRRYRLLPAVAVTGAAGDILALAGEEWVTKVEEDRQVHTMAGGGKKT